MGRSIDFRFTASGCVALALMLLLLPLRWLLAWVAAAAFHEGCHALAVMLCGGRVMSVRLGTGGAEMGVTGVTGWRELICALAGPLGALVLLFFARLLPAMAVCALFQSAYNLLPLYPLDGGRAIRCILERLCPRYGEVLCRWIARVTLAALWIGAAWAAFAWKIGILPLILMLTLHLKTNLRKIPCNKAGFAVQ